MERAPVLHSLEWIQINTNTKRTIYYTLTWIDTSPGRHLDEHDVINPHQFTSDGYATGQLIPYLSEVLLNISELDKYTCAMVLPRSPLRIEMSYIQAHKQLPR